MLPIVKCFNNSFRLRLLAGILSLVGCGFQSERPVHRDRVEVGTDAKGRIVYKKFDQLIDDRYGRSLATITQHFDTAGRLVSEFGIDHPRLGKQYLYEIFYGHKMRVVNYFRWPQIDSSQLNIIPPAAFEEQRIIIDTASFTKLIRITKIGINNKAFTGRYLETFPSAKNTSGTTTRIHAYTFKMPLQNFVFDSETRLVLKDLTVMMY